MDILEKLEWRYATKQFDSSKILSEEKVEKLIKAANLTATSFGLQPVKVVLVENPAVREELVNHSWGQKQVAEASHLLVISVFKDLNDTHVDEFVERMAETRSIPAESLDGMSNMIKGFLSKMNEGQKKEWMTNQAHIVMGNLLTVCAVEEIDSCPIAGFVPKKYDEVLNLDEDNLESVLVLPVGYRLEEDKYANLAKVRMSDSEFLVRK